jgi:hypothetical protein
MTLRDETESKSRMGSGTRLLRPFRVPCLFAAALLSGSGCSYLKPDPASEAGLNFAAHKSERGLVIDRMGDGQKGVVVPADCPLFCDGPQLVLRSDDAIAATFWLHSETTVVRHTEDAVAAPIGAVESSWEESAIRLTFKPEGQEQFETSTFERIAGGFSDRALGQPVAMTLDAAGLYRGQIVDHAGTPVGWLRVRIAQVGMPPRVYDGVLPAVLNGPLGAAAVARLDAAIDRVQRQAINPFLGN